MISFPNCKINLGLNIIRKRSDGFHDIETIFYPVPLTDVLEIIPSQNGVDLHLTGINISNSHENLCLKAYRLLKKDHPHLPAVNIYLHKVIPAGAGLGGGSSDAAFTMKMLVEKFNLAVSTQQLQQYALELGSDCPFFLLNKPCLASGRGEIIEEITFTLEGYTLLLVNPGIHISTKEAFAMVAPKKAGYSLKEIVQRPPASWKELKNDFEEPIANRYLEIKQIKDDLYNSGAIYAAMSGSGSTVFGIYHNQQALPEIKLQYFNKAFKF